MDVSAVQEFNADTGKWDMLPAEPPAETTEVASTAVAEPKDTETAAPVVAETKPPVETKPDWEAENRRPTNAEARKDPKARIAQQTWDQRQAQREAQDAKAEAARLRAELEAVRAPKPAAPPEPAPAADKFPDFSAWLQSHPDQQLEDWLDARDQWRDQRRDATLREQAQLTQIERTFTEKAGTFSAKYDAAIKARPELAERLDPALLGVRPYSLLTPQDKETIRRIADPREREAVAFRCFLADQWLEAEHPVELLAHLSHPSEFQRLATLPPAKVVRELAILDASFGAASARGSAPERPAVSSQAPAPITPLRGSTPQTPDDSPSEDDDDETWRKKEEARLLRLRTGRTR